MPKGKNHEFSYVNKWNENVYGNETEIEFYKKCEKAEELGIIKHFEYQSKFELLPRMKGNRGRIVQKTDHYVDFLITRKDGYMYVVDTKGSGGMKSHDGEGKLKRKIFMHTYGLEYYMISKLSKYLGGYWVDSSPGNDLINMTRKLYQKLHPWMMYKPKDKKTLKQKRWSKGDPTIDKKVIDKYIKLIPIDRLFYTTDESLPRKIEPFERYQTELELK